MAQEPNGMVEREIEFPGEGDEKAVTEPCEVTKIGLYRLENVLLLSESASYLDIIAAEELDERRVRFLSVVKPSGWRVLRYFVSREWADSEIAKTLLQQLDTKGGRWQRDMGGLLAICVPPGRDDLMTWIEKAFPPLPA